MSLKNWDDDSYPVKGEIELFGSVWSTKGGFGEEKNEPWRWNQPPARTDHLAAVSIQSPLTYSRQPHHREHQRSDERWQILIEISDRVCSKACNNPFQPDRYQYVYHVSPTGFSYIGCIIENMWLWTCHLIRRSTNFQRVLILNEAQHCHHVD